MDFGTAVNIVQAFLWIIAGIGWVSSVMSGKTQLPRWLAALGATNVLGLLIVLGFTLTCIEGFLYHRIRNPGDIEDLNVTALPPPGETANLALISGETYSNQTVQLDGHAFDHVTFVDSCLLYDGGAFNLSHVTIRHGDRVCVHQQSLMNYMSLLEGMKMMRPGSPPSEKHSILIK